MFPPTSARPRCWARKSSSWSTVRWTTAARIAGVPASTFPSNGNRQPLVAHRAPAGERRPGAAGDRAFRQPPLARSRPAGATARSSRKPPSTAAASPSCAPPAQAPSDLFAVGGLDADPLALSRHDRLHHRRRGQDPGRGRAGVCGRGRRHGLGRPHRRINPFGAWPSLIRRASDPVLRPLERRVVRMGGNPQDAPLWLIGSSSRAACFSSL